MVFSSMKYLIERVEIRGPWCPSISQILIGKN